MVALLTRRVVMLARFAIMGRCAVRILANPPTGRFLWFCGPEPLSHSHSHSPHKQLSAGEDQ